MKTAGDVLSALFDERFMKKAEGVSKLFDSWTNITAKNGIAAAADHSRIKDMDRGILLVEMDHPGWKQIIQTKQAKLLNDFRRRFPELGISGISLMLARPEPQTAETPPLQEQSPYVEEPSVKAAEEIPAKGYDAIKDEDFKETLKRLGKNIAAREKRR
jgi:hypothetical protein